MRRTAIAVDKRVVIEHKQGPRAGIKEIAGLVSKMRRQPDSQAIPAFYPAVNFGDRIADVELAKVETHYVLYREIVPTPIEDDGA